MRAIGNESGGRNARHLYFGSCLSPTCFLLGSYLPLVSTFCFSSSFIFLMVSSRLASPVVCVVDAAGALFGTEVCSGSILAGRVAVVLGGALSSALAA